MDTPKPLPPELRALLEALDRAETAEERQRAWDALVQYQRQREIRAQPSEPPQPPR
jgi:hypothetical protein